MSFFKTVTALALVGVSLTSYADEVSKKACVQFLPALGDNNIDLINNGIKRDYADTDKAGKKLAGILKNVDDEVSKNTQERCDKGVYPIMDLSGCYTNCKSEAEKQIKGTFAWNYQERTAAINVCYTACTGAYVAQNAITKTLRKVAIEDTQCGAAPQVFDSRKSKQLEGIMQNNSASGVKSPGMEK